MTFILSRSVIVVAFLLYSVFAFSTNNGPRDDPAPATDPVVWEGPDDATRRGAAGVKCIFPSAPGYQNGLEDAIESLSKKGLDNCQVGGGPKTCVKVACSRDSSIFLCNDNSKPLSVLCIRVADYAQMIVHSCHKPSKAGTQVIGQAFDTDNFNVYVDGTGC
ncbi:hypothetical protein Egran_03244 [Elaphomyces granulatus]|uniref:Secreted protein n=1 Tax=Elaphomyces granulatus TaxID=519963 RepID=A0A232LXV3_9EURO|nr:hypothetical protein Egran_03244 [Elaphomyces granulatus]